MRFPVLAALTILLSASAARADVASSLPPPGLDATGKALSAVAPAGEKGTASVSWKIPAPSGPPHVARPYRGPKPEQEGLQLEATPPACHLRAARFLGWALVP